MIDPIWYRVLPQVVEDPDFQKGIHAGRSHWWTDWHGEATPEEIAAFLTEDWSYSRAARRNQEAQERGLPVISGGYAAGFVLGWAEAVFGD